MDKKQKKTYKPKSGSRKSSFKPKDFNVENDLPAVQENDWTWYAANAQLLKDAASIPFSNSLGTIFDVGNAGAVNNRTVPGIMLLHFVPSVGSSIDANSAMNIAARNVNSWVRHANSGSRNYESSDLFMTILASSSVYDYIMFLERLYGIARVYSQSNRYLAKALLAAQVGDDIADSIIANLSDFRAKINIMIVKASTMCVPKGFTFIDRHVWLNSHIWADGTNEKHQIYIPLIDRFYKYDPTKYSTGGSLELTTFSKIGTYDTLFTTLTQMLDALIRDDDVNLMWGDIVKAYGDNGVYKLVSLPEEYAVNAEYSEEVLSQFNNLDTITLAEIGETFVSNSDAVVQLNNVLYSPLECYIDTEDNGDLISTYTGKLFTIRKDHPEPSDIMVASRLMIGVDNTQSLSGITNLLAGTTFATKYQNVDDIRFTYGTEICYSSEVFILNKATLGATRIGYLESHMNEASLTPAALARISVFDWHPIIMLCDSGNLFTGCFGDLQNYTVLNYNDLVKLHNCAIMNEFAIPQLGIVK